MGSSRFELLENLHHVLYHCVTISIHKLVVVLAFDMHNVLKVVLLDVFCDSHKFSDVDASSDVMIL